MPDSLSSFFNFQNTYASLHEHFFFFQKPDEVKQPKVVVFNDALASLLGLDFTQLSLEEKSALLSGNHTPSTTEPISQAYAGHQFGHFTMLGDGRAVLLGEHITPDGKRFDIQFKGSGRTPYSRGGDGRATLYSMLREFLISEAMHYLGIPTTRSLSVTETGQPVYRQETQKGGVLVRVAASHIRVGTFEFARNFLGIDQLQQLLDYTINRHYPELKESENPALGLLQTVMKRQISLIVDWMRVGFIHGVMNTDNMALSGETIDYGPCAFMNVTNPATVFSSIDENGRYAFGRQPVIAHWNLAVLAGALLPLVHENQDLATQLIRGVMQEYPKLYESERIEMMRKKVGFSESQENDAPFLDQLLELMTEHQADYTNTFASFFGNALPSGKLFQSEKFKQWNNKRLERISTQKGGVDKALELMSQSNPVYIPRNHKVEEALKNAAFEDDFQAFEKLLAVIRNPYEYRVELQEYQNPPENDDIGYQTFCGT